LKTKILRLKFRAVFVSLLAAAVFVSCASRPPAGETPPGMEFVPLNPGALVYVYADIASSRPILEAANLPGLGNRYAAEILDRSDNAALAFFPGGGMSVQALVHGAYPASRANISFFFSRAWKKHKSERGASFWFSANDGISVALNKDQVFLGVKNRNGRGLPAEEARKPVDPFGPRSGQAVPDGFRAYREGAALALWIDDPAANLSAVLETLSIPLQIPAETCFAALDPLGDGSYSGRIRMEFAQPSQARAILVLMTMAGALMPRMESGLEGTAALASLILANPPSQDGSAVDLITAPLGPDEIALLFRPFSLSSK
jgi:hypothetical protein